MTARRGRGWLIFGLRASVSLAFLALALATLDWRRLGAALDRLDAGSLAASALIDVALFFLLAVRWWLMVRPAAPLPFARHLAIYFSANLMNTLTPANLGGDVYRVVALRKHGATGDLAVALVRERLIGLAGYFLGYLACVAVLWATVAEWRARPTHPLNVTAAVGIVALVAVAAGGWLAGRLASSPWVERRDRLKTFALHARRALRLGAPARTALLFALTFAALALWTAAVWVIARRLTPEVPLAALAAVVVIAEVVRLVPITVQGLGVREAAYAFSFEALGADGEAGFLVGAAAYLVLTAVQALTGAAGLLVARDTAAGPTETGSRLGF